MNLEDILKMWAEDSVIDDHQLDKSSIDTAKLHSKYLEIFTVTKLQLKKAETALDNLLKDKWLWYNGKLDKAAIDSKGWAYDPFDGCNKPLKGEMDYYYNADPDIQKAKARVDLLEVQKETIEEIITNLKWRHQTIGNAIRWRQFLSGD